MTTPEQSVASPEGGDTLFIADLHLQANRPETLNLANHYLERARGAAALYVLGDLVEYWLGDDAPSPGLETLFANLSAVSSAGTAVYLMHGNRDFLLGEAFADQIGATLIRNNVISTSLGLLRVSLMHGDTLCTGDHDYQALRQKLRNPEWQTGFLSRPIAERRQLAEEMRRSSREASAAKTDTIMDVDPAAVEREYRRSNCDVIVHGHTHRPAEHHLDVLGKPRRRLVVGDWHPDKAIVARWDGEYLALETFAG